MESYYFRWEKVSHRAFFFITMKDLWQIPAMVPMTEMGGC